MDSYYVMIRSMPNDYRRQVRYSADSFAHAEEQAEQDVENNEEIISIDRDYKIFGIRIWLMYAVKYI